MKHEILALHAAGKSRKEIIETLGCTKSAVCYHLSPGQKMKSQLRNQKKRKKQPLREKWYRFLAKSHTESEVRTTEIKRAIYNKIRDFAKDRKTLTMLEQPSYTFEQVMEKIGPSPRCYLTGKSIDLNEPRSYHLDHIVPAARGGDNSLNNMGICTREANFAKRDLTVEEFHQLCKDVVAHLG